MLHEYWSGSGWNLRTFAANFIHMVPVFPHEPMLVARISVFGAAAAPATTMKIGLYRVSNRLEKLDFTAAELESGDMSAGRVAYEKMAEVTRTIGTTHKIHSLLLQPNVWLRDGVSYAIGVAADGNVDLYTPTRIAFTSGFTRAVGGAVLPATIDFRQDSDNNPIGDPVVCLRDLFACRRISQ